MECTIDESVVTINSVDFDTSILYSSALNYKLYVCWNLKLREYKYTFSLEEKRNYQIELYWSNYKCLTNSSTFQLCDLPNIEDFAYEKTKLSTTLSKIISSYITNLNVFLSSNFF